MPLNPRYAAWLQFSMKVDIGKDTFKPQEATTGTSEQIIMLTIGIVSLSMLH